VELVEESILSDPARTHGGRTLEDGSILDVTALNEFGIVLIFRRREDRSIEFTEGVFQDAG
jgi:hypothetical protein